MPAYVIASVHVTDAQQYSQYTAITPGIIAHFGGKFIVRGGPVETLEGPIQGRRVVVIEFPSMDKARAWYHSAEYGHARSLRAGAAEASFILVEGHAPPA